MTYTEAAPLRSPALPREEIRTRNPDDAVAPPFEALDRLANVINRADEIASTLIGRCSPYMTRNPDQPKRAVGQDVTSSERSSLEERVDGEAYKLMEIVARLEDLNDGLRL